MQYSGARRYGKRRARSGSTAVHGGNGTIGRVSVLTRDRRRPPQAARIQQPESAPGIQLDTAELQCLRQEITTRITLMNGIIALELATIGTGLTAISRANFVLVGLAAASSFLWLLWMDQSLYTYKIAAYLAVELAPRLGELVQRPVLGWEGFVRLIEANGESSEHALYPHSAGKKRHLRFSGRHAEWYVPLLFLVTPLLLLARYTVEAHRSAVLIAAACVVGGSIWVYTVTRFALLTHDIKVLNDAILTARARQTGSQPS